MTKYMKLKALIIILSILAIIVFINILGINHTKEQVPEYVFTYAENQPEDYPTTWGGYKFAELVQEKSNGRIKIIVQSEGVLGDEKSVIQQIQYGGIDFTRASLSSMSETIPKLNVLQMPYLYTDSKHMWKVLEGEIGNDFLQSFTDYNMVALSWYDAGARNFYNNKQPITSLEDMKGLKIRVQESDLMIRMVEALGATAIPMAYGDVYTSLETGIVDGAENNWPSYEATSNYEVAKYYTIDEHTRVPEVQLCSKFTWDKLTPEDQDIIRECAKESAVYERALWIESEKQSEKIVTEKGVEVVTLSTKEKERFREAEIEVYKEFCGEYMDIIEEIINEKQ
jgi:tripartite ATP-independent transporter DctP family solute receptor